MKLSFVVLQHGFRKCLCNKDLLAKYDAEDSQDFAQTEPDFELFFDNRDQSANADRNPDSSLETILGCGKRVFDSKALFIRLK